MAGRFHGRTAVITGSGQSIGRSIALLMAREGANVVVNSRSEVSHDQTPTAADTFREIEAAGGRAALAFGDVGTMAGARAVIDAAQAAFGGVDILVNNAGGGTGLAAVEDISEEDWDRAIATNLRSQYLCTSLAVPHMRRAGWGRVINMGSSIGLVGLALMSSYAAAKGGVIGLTQALAHEFAGTGITANVIHPSANTTRSDKTRAEREAQTGLRTMISPQRVPDAVAPLVGYLASDAAAGVTGQVFAINGGKIRQHRWPPVESVLWKAEAWTIDELETQFPLAFGREFKPTMPGA